MANKRIGRFTTELNKAADSFNSSLPFDARLYSYDIKGSLAHSKMLADCGIISHQDAADIERGLNSILVDIESGALEIKDAEDIHMFVETELTKRVGDAGKRLHTARSRNDQVATDTRLYVLDSIDALIAKLKRFVDVLIGIAKQNTETLMPGYTHMQKAQPVTLAHHLVAYCEMLLRDISRLTDCRIRTNVMPLGSCALAGTAFPIDRTITAKLLGFEAISNNSMDSVSDRDFCIEFIFCLSVIMMHLSRLNEEMIYWASDEFDFIELDDAFSTGSSIMPNKKNPDINELMRGKTGRVYGDLVALLTTMKALPLAYNKDMQEDKEALFDADDTVNAVLDILPDLFLSIKFKKINLFNGASGGFTAATEIADYLVKKGLPFRQSYDIAGKIVLHCVQNKKTLQSLIFEDFLIFSPLFSQDIVEIVKLENIIQSKNSAGGVAPNAVKKSIKNIEKILEKIPN